MDDVVDENTKDVVEDVLDGLEGGLADAEVIHVGVRIGGGTDATLVEDSMGGEETDAGELNGAAIVELEDVAKRMALEVEDVLADGENVDSGVYDAAAGIELMQVGTRIGDGLDSITFVELEVDTGVEIEIDTVVEVEVDTVVELQVNTVVDS